MREMGGDLDREGLAAAVLPLDRHPHPKSSEATAWWRSGAWVSVLLVSDFLVFYPRLFGRVISGNRSTCAHVPCDCFWVRQVAPSN